MAHYFFITGSVTPQIIRGTSIKPGNYSLRTNAGREAERPLILTFLFYGGKPFNFNKSKSVVYRFRKD